MAKSITDQLGGFINDYSMIDFLTITMWVGFFVFFLELFNANRDLNDKQKKFTEWLSAMFMLSLGRTSTSANNKSNLTFEEGVKRLARKDPTYQAVQRVRESEIYDTMVNLRDRLIKSGRENNPILRKKKKKVSTDGT